MTHPLRMRFCLPVAAALAAVLSAVPAATGAAPESGQEGASGGFVPGQVIVRYEPGTSAAQRADARDDAGTRTIEGLGMARTQLLKVTDGGSVSATVRQLEAQPEIAYAEPNRLLELAALPNDPDFLNGNQWGLYNDGQTVEGVTGVPEADIDAPAAWNVTTGAHSTVVAVMDTGADLQHPDLVNELWTNPDEIAANSLDDDGNGLTDDVNGWDFLGDAYDKDLPATQIPDGDPTDLSGHGTHVSGIALAEGNNGIGMTGVSQHADLMSLRICGTYDNQCPTDALLDAIDYAADEGARVVNGSISGGSPSQAVADALESHPNTLYVFSAGNGDENGNGLNNDTIPNFPCTADQGAGYGADNLICVAATDQADRRADFSNYGASSVDLGAPGVNIYSTSAKRAFFSDDFEGGDFAARWTNTSGPGWATSSEAPLTSVGVTDSPAAPYPASTTNAVTSNPVTLDPGYSSCEIHYDRAINLAAGDTFEIAALLDTDAVPDGIPDAQEEFTFDQDNNSGLLGRFFPLHSGFDPGGQLQVRLTLTSDGTGEAQGVHMDEIEVICFGSASDNGYEFMDGTSMAAPMVSGAAGLLFSDDPSMTATQVKEQLLDSVDSVPDLAGSTVSGGRLNAYGALISEGGNPAGGGGGNEGGGAPQTGAPAPPPATGSANRRPDTFFRRQPGRVVRTKKRRAKVVFRFGATEAGTSYRCRLDRRRSKAADRRGKGRLERRRQRRLDRGRYKRCGKRFVRRLRPGRYVLKVKAIDRDGASDASAAVRRFRVKRVQAR